MDMPEMVQNRTTEVAEVAGDEIEERLRLGLIVDLDAGFGELVRAHERVVYSVALRLSTTPADAEDVAAETFLRAFRALRGYDAARIHALRLRPWLLTILRNTARNAARDAGRRPGPPPEFEPAETAVAGPSVEEQVEQDLTQREWARCCAGCPKRSGRRWCCGTSRACRPARSPRSSAAPRARPSPTSRGGCAGCGRCWPRCPTRPQRDVSPDRPRAHDRVQRRGSMMVNELAAVTAALGGLRHAGPPGLERRVFTGWLSAPSRLGEVFVAFTGDGVQFVRSAESVGGDPAAFAAAYRRRFARPLRRADRAPAGLLPALRGRRGAARAAGPGRLTEFERGVLTATRRIPAGETRPYGWVAREAGRPGRSARPPRCWPATRCRCWCRATGWCAPTAGSATTCSAPARKEELLRGEDANLDDVAEYARRGVHYLGSDTTGVVCFPTCHHARRITPAHRSGFATVADAVAAGYRPCRTCRPASRVRRNAPVAAAGIDWRSTDEHQPPTRSRSPAWTGWTGPSLAAARRRRLRDHPAAADRRAVR